MLYLKNLKIKNFKNIEDLDFKFSRINLFSGDAGEGKTAILQAITFLLCNYLEGNIEDYINWKNNSSDFELYLKFKYMLEDYEYNITCGQNTYRELITPIDTYVRSDSYKYIFENILDPNITLYSNISEQEKTSSLLFEPPARGLEIIKKIFKLDTLNEKVEIIKSEIKENKENISILKAEKDLLENRQFEFFEEPIIHDIDIDKLNEKLKLLEDNKKLYLEEYKQYEIYKEKLNQYEKSQIELKKIDIEYNQINDKLNDLNNQLINNEFNENELIEIEDKKIKLEKEIIVLEQDLKYYNDTQNKIKDLLDKIEKIQQQISNIKISRVGRCNYSEKDIKILDDDIYLLKLKIHENETKIKLHSNGSCPTCNTKFDKDENIVLSFKQEIIDIEKQISDLENKKDNIKNEIDSFKDKLVEVEKNTEKKNNLTEKLDEYIEEKNNIKDIEKIDLSIIDEKGNILNNICNNIKLIKEKKNIYDEVNNAIKDLNNRLSLIREKRKILSLEKPDEFIFTLDFNEDEFDELKDKINDYNFQIKERDRIIELNNKIRKEKEQVNKDKIFKEKELERLNRRNYLLDKSQKIIGKDFSAYIIDTQTSYLNMKMNEFFQRSYNGKYSIKFEQNKRGIGFYYSDDGKDNWHSTITLSGVERQLFSIGFRLALTTLQNIKILLLDEIDSNASSEKSLQLYRNLFNDDKIDQFFVVTHNEETKEFIRNQQGYTDFCIEDGKII